MVKQTNIDAQVNNAHCPRCGYDLRGIMETWENACDIFGTCSECGLEYEWGDLLNPDRNVPDWSLEHARETKDFLIRIVRTLGMIFKPKQLWTELRMTHSTRWRPIIMANIVLLFATYVFFVLALGIHVGTGRMLSTSTLNGISDYEFVLHTMLLPFSSKNVGTIVSGPFGPPASSLLYTKTFIYYWGWSAVGALPYLLLYLSLCPIGFLALPQSRRIAKVRWIHVLRIFAYTMLLVWPLVVCLLVLIIAQPVISNNFNFINGELLLVSPYCLVFILACPSWSFASSLYLKMQHGWAIGLAVSLMALLATITVYALIYIDWTS